MERFALIPALEPDEKMLKTAKGLKELGFEIIFIDDGSGSAYAPAFAQAQELGTVLRHSKNLGKGAAIKTGLAYLAARTAPCVAVTVDADGQHLPCDALRAAKEAEKRPDSLILGSRRFTGRVPLKSRFGNTVTRAVFRLASGASVYDTQTGLRAFASDHFQKMLEIKGDRYEYEMNVLLEYGRGGLPIREIPIETVYIEGNASSHFRALSDSARIYGEILKFSLSSLLSFFIDYALFALLSAATAALGAFSAPVSNVGARLVSAALNFTVNRRVVFKSDKSLPRTAVEYFALALFILLGNTCLLTVLVNTAGVSRYLAKLLTEATFFFLSFFAQKHFIFRKKRTGEGAAAAKDIRAASE